jgi:nucleoside-diphosphate-sugar epimerase
MDIAPQPEALAEIVDVRQITLVQGDILKPFVLSEAIHAHGVTALVHTAGNPLFTIGAQRDPYAAIQTNIMGTVNVLEAARINKLKRVVISSSSVLSQHIEGGADKGDAMKEEAFPRPSTFYAATKQAIESIALNYARWNDVDFAGMRYAAVAGPWNGKGGGGPSNIFRAAVESALRGEEAVIPASGMDWVYSKDAAAGTVLALKAKTLRSRIFNIGTGRFSPPEDLKAALERVFPKARIRIETPQGSSPPNVGACDIGRARAELGYAPRFDLDNAIRDLAAFLRGKNSPQA